MVMIPFLLATLVVFLLVVFAELLWRYRNLDPEYTRKFVHISVGTFVAFWPFFLEPLQIAILSLAFVAVVGASYFLNIFKAIHSVQRPTWGEVFFALAVGTVAYIAHNPWVYLVALLHMSLADGLAAIIGLRFGRSTRYKVFGHDKSVVGTLTFMAISTAIFVGFFAVSGHPFTPLFVPVTLAAAVLENAGIQGLDNLLVPLLVAVSLNILG